MLAIALTSFDLKVACGFYLGDGIRSAIRG